MKKTIAILIMGCLLVSFVACEKNQNPMISITSDRALTSNSPSNHSVSAKPTTIINSTTVAQEKQSLIINEIKLIKACSKISIQDDFPCSTIWKPTSQDKTLEKVISWLNKAQVYTDNVPASSASAKNAVFYANILPSTLSINSSNNHIIMIQPVMYLIESGNGFQRNYLENVLKLTDGDSKVYIQSKQLYDWLKNDKWQSNFVRN